MVTSSSRIQRFEESWQHVAIDDLTTVIVSVR